MSKISVCHFVSGLKCGGSETMIYNYCKAIGNKDYEWHLLYQHEPLEKNVKEFESLGFKLKRLSSKKKHPIKNIIETYKYLKQNKIQIVHCHMTFANFIPLYIAKILNIKIRICHSHESRDKEKNFFKNFMVYICKKLCLSSANKYVACGLKAGEFLYGNNDFVVLNNALDLGKFSFDNKKRNDIRKKLKIENDEILIGHVGRFIDVKNHMFIIEIFKNLILDNKKYKMIFIGSGELEPKIKEYTEINNITSNVIFTGTISNVEEYYNALDLFVLPSKREGLPLVAIEAQVNGVKCFLSKSIDSNVCITNLCKMLPLDKEIWISEIKRLNPEYKRTIDENNDIKKYDIYNEIKKLENIYKELNEK